MPNARPLVGLVALLATVSACRAERDALGSSADATTTSAAPTAAPSITSAGAAAVSAVASASPDDAPEGAEPIPSRPAPELLSFLPWVVSNCYIDEIGPSEYTAAWLQFRKEHDFVPPGQPKPLRRGKALPTRGSSAALELATRLRADWLAHPRSHVVDCRFEVPQRRCPACTRQPGVGHSHYIAYLPAALSTSPDDARSVLLLVPGGRGNRSRFFLTPIPGRTLFQENSGGLETRRLVDEHLAAHPGASPAVVVALDTTGYLHNNGVIEHLTHDAPRHIADTYLSGRSREELAIGAEGISSGARAIILSLRAKPDAFDVVGLTCMACGGVDPDTRLGPREEVDAWASALARRAERGLFQARFSIGGRDRQVACNKRFYDRLASHGLFPAGRAPTFSNCPEGHETDVRHCDAAWESFTVFGGEAHHYGLLVKSYPPALAWDIGALTKAAKARREGQR